MNRIRLRRALSIVTALVFLLVRAGDLFALHPCPHHDLLGPGAAHHAPHPAAGAASAEHHDGAPSGDEGHAECTCLGACPSVSVSATAPPVRAPLAVAAEVVTVVPAGIAEPDVLLPRLSPFILPYAQAPPPAL